MAVTTLDQKTALIVVDLQKGLVSSPTVHPTAEVVKQASTLADTFRSRGLPVVLVNVAGAPPGRTEQAPRVTAFPAGWMDIVPELRQRPGDHTVTKRTAGAFTNTDLEAYLKSRNVTQVVIVGVSTSMGVEATARHARDLGFNVTLALDAMTDTNLDAHTNSIVHIFPRLGETGTTLDIIDLLAKRSA
ncbi:cysteine hydrolase [Mesorhizobium sp. AR07]|uniref:cysteine hydrolase family protein n=1 Tax=Mesorhizobium sp. AR07 TaxID=2865838 RepID=UPI002160D7C8|nr:cysteine hydrolase [Mesorhizobium sp. AR07]UVK47068.1 cysteine hydrolase [Mesorhizobium sp. AR07]